MKIRSVFAILLCTAGSPAPAQTGPWYQVEVSIFAHDSTDLSQEQWEPQVQRAISQGLGTQRGMQLTSQLDFLDLEDWSILDPPLNTGTPSTPAPLIEPQVFDPAAITLPDFNRDPFLRLPAADQNFRQTNQSLERSPDYRLLWHAAWRQPMQQTGETPYIAVAGGRELDGGPEMNGTLRAYFSPDTTRVILDAELWRAVMDGGETARLPMHQTRAMISNEFHYMDHPALGILVEVFRYDESASGQ